MAQLQAIAGGERGTETPDSSLHLEVKEIDTYYGDSHILHQVSLGIRRGRVTAVLGRNGVGKTTLVRSIVGFTPPRRGIIRFEGEEIQNLPSHEIIRRGIGLVPQGRRIFRSLTVLENLKLAGLNARSPQRWTVESIFKLFPRLEERQRNYGDQLSGGEQQMLAIGRALMGNPSLLLMDEPSEGLAPIIVDRLQETILELRNMGLSILLIEQNLRLALAVAEDAYIISRGKVVWYGDAQEIARNEELRGRYLAV